MNIFEQIIHDQEQRRRDSTVKMSKTEAQALLFDGLKNQDFELVSLAVKNGARVRGMVDGQDLFTVALGHFNLPIFNLVFPDKKIKALKDVHFLISEGDMQCLEYFSNDIFDKVDCCNYAFHWQLERNTNENFVQWLNTHFDDFIEYNKQNSKFRSLPQSFTTAFMIVLKFSARMECLDLVAKVVQRLVSESISSIERTDCNVFDTSLDNIAKIAHTIDTLPENLKNTAHTFLNLEKYASGGDLWMDNAVQRNPKHIETVLKSSAGCQYVEKMLAQPKNAENFLYNCITDRSIPNLTQWYNIFRLKNVYKDWISEKGLNIVQHLTSYAFHRVTVDDFSSGEHKKLVDVLLRINPNAFHEPFPQSHEHAGTTAFDKLPADLQSKVSKFSLQQEVGATRSIKTHKVQRKM